MKKEHPLTFARVVKDESEGLGIDSPAVIREEQQPDNLQAPANSPPPPLGPIGLALSGGGIRSATFSLGVLQALANAGKLASFDYLSTVSGGGYVGAWLSAWIHRSCLKDVQTELARSASTQFGAPQSQEAPEVSWLRRYSNYLSPRLGLFSGDSWTLAATWIRNVFLNLVVVIAFLVCLLLAPALLLPATEYLLAHSGALSHAAAWFGMAVLPLAISINLLHMDWQRQRRQQPYWLITPIGVMLTVIAPGLVAAILGGIWPFAARQFSARLAIAFIFNLILLLTAVGLVWFVIRFSRARWGQLLKEVGVYGVAAFFAICVAVGLMWAAQTVYQDMALDAQDMLTWGPPVFLIAFSIASSVFVGLVGTTYFERSREWWSRMHALFLVLGVLWLAWMACAFYVPALVTWIQSSAGTWLTTALGAGWLGTLGTSLLAPKTKDLPKRAQRRITGVLNAAAIVFIIGFVVLVTVLAHQTLVKAAGVDVPTPAASAELTQHIFHHQEEFRALRNARLPVPDIPLLPFAFACSLLVLLFFGWRVDVNKFSMHNMYKNRLIRCYLGASNLRRNPQPFTGFDDDDDVELARLASKRDAQPWVQRPYHIFNAALNISQGKNLAWQERKAAAFAFTPLYCGYALAGVQGDITQERAKLARMVELQLLTDEGGSAVAEPPPAYRPTESYASSDPEEHGFSLGRAMATSGAAASPNMGANTRPALAFVMTLFNVRIGRWCSNTAGGKWLRPSPPLGFLALIQELFGWSDERSDYIYLSDGGHFDNLGIYELVRRRCSRIWVVDASADPRREFSDLGRAIRQCRIDLGVEIDLPLEKLQSKRPGRLPELAIAEGTISYGPHSPPGTIVYIKPTLCATRSEPVDVLAFASGNPTFPHQTTADQFFSESQFESYRRLGFHIGSSCIAQHGTTLPTIAPDGVQSRSEEIPMRQPRPVSFWFAIALLATIVGAIALTLLDGHYDLTDRRTGNVQTRTVERASPGLLSSVLIFAPTRRDEIHSGYSTDAEGLMRYAERTATEPPTPGTETDWKPRLPNAAQTWLWLDNVLIAIYMAMFVLGFMSIRYRVVPQPCPRGVGIALYSMMSIAVVGGLIDYGENFMLFDGMRKTATAAVGPGMNDSVALLARDVGILCALKFLFFLLSSALLVISAAVFGILRWREAPLDRSGSS